jgi:DnaJ-class molecular chaperone
MSETTFTFFTFQEWCSANPEIKELHSDDECLECDGEGEYECNYGDYHECNFCDGTGKNNKVVTLEEIYKDQRKKDEELLLKWTAGQARVSK